MNNHKKAFTLIELIVVIAILSILATLIVPSVSTYIKKAKETAYDANARICYEAAIAAQASYQAHLIDNIKTEMDEIVNAQVRPGGRCLVSHVDDSVLGQVTDLNEDNSEEFADLSIDKAVWLTGSGVVGNGDTYRGIYSPDPNIRNFFDREK